MWRWLAGQIPWFLCHGFAAPLPGGRPLLPTVCVRYNHWPVVTLPWCRKSRRSRHGGYPCRRSREVHIVASWPRVPGWWWRPFGRSRCFRRPGDTGVSGDSWCDPGFYITIMWASFPSGKMELPNQGHSCSCMGTVLCVQHEKDKGRFEWLVIWPTMNSRLPNTSWSSVIKRTSMPPNWLLSDKAALFPRVVLLWSWLPLLLKMAFYELKVDCSAHPCLRMKNIQSFYQNRIWLCCWPDSSKSSWSMAAFQPWFLLWGIHIWLLEWDG